MTNHNNSARPTLVTRIITLTSAIIFTLCLAPDGFSQSDGSTHTVRPGDTLYSISQQYDITVGELRQWNDLGTDDLQTGILLRVEPPEQQDAITHTVAPRETLFSISRRYNVTIAEIQRWNNFESTALSVGQTLLIYSDSEEAPLEMPAPAISEADEGPRESIVRRTAPPGTYYTVQSGDYLNRIASEHNMTTDELRSLNNLDSDMLRVGQQLVVRESQNTPVVDEATEASTPQGRFVNYTLESGDDLPSLLERFSMNREELSALNPGTDIESLRSGQRLTVLLPPTRSADNPYRKEAGLRDLGDVSVQQYSRDDIARPTTSGELYNPDQLTAAHANMTLGSIVFLENPENGLGVYVKIHDRFSGGGIKLSERAYELLGFASESQATVTIYQEE